MLPYQAWNSFRVISVLTIVVLKKQLLVNDFAENICTLGNKHKGYAI